MPALNNTPKVTDKQLKEGADAELRIVPQKDIARIASISKTPLTNISLPAFLAETDAKVTWQLKQESKTMGDEIYRLIKAEHNSAAETGNAAIGLWMMG